MSMTTELAQRMKAAAIRAKAATEDYVANRMSMSVCLSECEEFNNLSDGPDNIIALVEALEAKEEQRANWFHMAEKLGSELDIAEKRIADLERMESTLRPVGVMSQKAYCRLENRESRFIALWPRPEIYLPRKRPDDGVIVFARTAAGVAVEGE
ncbi:ead/Ea22-like family protein [Pseudocitrobacter faecalis]|uniref:ead/Ea22-like family protein n=1 Tax=Pseudocitrobacter faecalis TaxID=1398493 RepID=UPI00331511B1